MNHATAENPYKASPVVDSDLQYRSLNRAAVGSVVMVVLGLTSLIFWQLAILPIAGLLLGYSGYRSIRRYPLEYTGLNVARFGMVACVLLFCGSVGYHSYVYATEVPEGYMRVSFSELQPDYKTVLPIPKRAVELRGERIFIKGYMHPGVSGMGKVNQFVLVPDMGTCCFGGQPKLTDMILVNTTSDAKVRYGTRLLRLGGEFDLGEQMQDFGEVKNVLYRLEADYSK